MGRALAWADGSTWADRHWRWIVAAVWLLACGVLLYMRWRNIYWFSLADTDDNLRAMQVRALLAGQDWYDLRQYRLDPPGGVLPAYVAALSANYSTPEPPPSKRGRGRPRR